MLRNAAGQRVITCCWDEKINPLEAQARFARSGKPARPPLRHRDGVLYATFSHNGRQAITCGEDFFVILWNPATGGRLARPLRHRDRVRYAAFSQDDRLVATVA